MPVLRPTRACQSPWTVRCMSTQPLPRPYRFHVGASWAGKPPEPEPRLRKRLRGSKEKVTGFSADSKIGAWTQQMLASFGASGKGRGAAGEDFFYVQSMRNNSGVSMGVADGVGGWSDSGVDPSLFSQALMYHAHRCSKTAWAGEPEIDPTVEDDAKIEGGELVPLDCLEIAYGGVLNERGVNAGSSTACIVHLNSSSGLLRAANLGDSGFVIIRSSAVIHSQPSQTHFFNCPRQLSKFPGPKSKWSDNISDVPQDADLYTTKLRDGDIVILFTDGLSDNVFDSELAQICSLVARTTAGEPEDVQVQAIADRITEYARACMFNLKRVSPFEKAARKAGKIYRGGKVDDVTVVVALIRETL